MAFSRSICGLMRQNLHKSSLVVVSTPTSHMFNAMRCMATKLFVGGLSFGTDDNSLREAFASFGEVTEARVITDRDTGRSRGFGFVNFTDDDSANTAISKMDGQELDGRNIRVNVANERPSGPRGGGYGGGGYGGGGGGGGFGGEGYGGGGGDRY